MIEYNPKAWFTFIFQFHRADTFRRLFPMMLCIAAYCGLVEYVAIASFPAALKDHLRALPPEQRQPLPAGLMTDARGHVPSQIASAILTRLMKAGLSPDLLLLVNSEIRNYSEVCGACERIRNTPIPFSYSVFLKKFIFIYVMTMPVSYSVTLDWLVIPVVVLVFYALASLELIAEEIENPFGTDPNDLPLESICETIRKSVTEILGDAAAGKPAEARPTIGSLGSLKVQRGQAHL